MKSHHIVILSSFCVGFLAGVLFLIGTSDDSRNPPGADTHRIYSIGTTGVCYPGQDRDFREDERMRESWGLEMCTHCGCSDDAGAQP